MKVVLLRLLGLLLLVAGSQSVYAELPLVFDLAVPERTDETLRQVDKGNDLASLKLKYESLLPSTHEAAIYWRSGWGEPGIVVLFKDSKGSYHVGTERRSKKAAEQYLDFAELEQQLAQRLIELIGRELARVGRGQTDNMIYVDVGTYYFTVASKPNSMGWTHGARKDTTLGRLCRVVDALTGLPGLTGSDRTGLLGEIDKGITAIEVAYDQRKQALGVRPKSSQASCAPPAMEFAVGD